ncbi:MAG: class I SAM-dependent methyltransferase [Acidobacteriota bacterium]|nr:class I SAM-dependent methyltransferase [Acidobacteriota bacterium]
MGFRVLRCSLTGAALLLLWATAASAQRSIDNYKNNLAPYVRSPDHAVQKMLDMAGLKPGETLYDLGCGDGKILIAAATKYRVKAVGVEISDNLARRATDRVKKDGLEDQVTIIHGDFMKTDLSHANVVTLYLVTTANEILRPNLERELRPNTRVVSYDYPIPGWKPIDTSETAGLHGATHTIYLYEVPDSIKK